jgi:hypothetical protein
VSQQLGALQTQTRDAFLFISHTTNVLLFKFRIIKEMTGSVASGTPYTIYMEGRRLRHKLHRRIPEWPLITKTDCELKTCNKIYERTERRSTCLNLRKSEIR